MICESVTGDPLLHHKNANSIFFFKLLQTVLMLSVVIFVHNIMPVLSSQPSDTEGNPEK